MAARVSDGNLKLQEFTKQYSQYENESEQYNDLNKKPGPHYEVPNMSSMLYDFTNKEQERIAQGFRIGNFVSLRDLPKELIAGNVLQN